MAISYSLEIDTFWSVDAVAAEVLTLGQAAGILSRSDTVDELLAGAATRLGTWIRVLSEKDESEPWASWDPVASTFGIQSKVSISFRLGKNDDLVLQDDDIIRLVAKLLERVPGDLILWMSESDGVWLVRRGDELTLSEQDDLWPAQRLGLVAHPYRRAPLYFEDS